MDLIVSRRPDWGLDLNKRFQLDYLIAHGLKPSMDFLDYGCGAIAAGRNRGYCINPFHNVLLRVLPELIPSRPGRKS